MKYTRLGLMLLAAITLASCKDKATQDSSQSEQTDSAFVAAESSTELKFETCTYDKATKYASVNIKVEMADDADENHVAAAINRGLIDEIDREYAAQGLYNDERIIAPYSGNEDDDDKILEYYGSPVLKMLTQDAKEVQDMREQTMSEAEADLAQENIVRNYHDLSITRSFETDKIIVFLSKSEAYYGGAHPGAAVRALVFDKTYGVLLDDWFTQNAAEKLQPLIRKGLVEYFKEEDQSVCEANLADQLLIDTKQIPLPSVCIEPTKDGITFTYEQYEIACYAAGMPSFTISYKDIRPYLSEKAKQLLPAE